MPNDVSFSFDFADIQDLKWIERIIRYKRSRSQGIPHDLIRRTVRSKVGQIFVIPCANAFQPNQPYDAQEICTILGPGWTKKKVASKLNTLGRLESQYAGVRIFGRPADGQYSLSQLMIDAIKNPNL